MAASSRRPEGQTVHAIDGDSAHPLTVNRLRRKLGGRRLDLLLIDGDHEFTGVQQDFLTYRRFVRNGGLIAFHDIMPVQEPQTGRSVGGVPAFWELVKPLYPSQELVADRRQEGLGVGVLTYQDSVSVESIEAAAES
ncbi:MAG: class I SAM-dependent methyltransferase [Solirubrobacteraceae bacterium]